MFKSGKRKESNTTTNLFVWLKEPLSGTNPWQVHLYQNAALVDFLETIIKNRCLKEWTDLKPNIFNVTKGVMLPHDTIIKNVNLI